MQVAGAFDATPDRLRSCLGLIEAGRGRRRLNRSGRSVLPRFVHRQDRNRH